MENKEASIGPEEESLAEKQMETVTRLSSARQKTKSVLVICIIVTLLSVILIFASYQFFKRTTTRLAGYIPPKMVVMKEDGTEEVYEVNQRILDAYGKANFLMGFTICFFLLLAVSSFSKVISCVVQMRIRSKFIDAFLSASKSKTTNAI